MRGFSMYVRALSAIAGLLLLAAAPVDLATKFGVRESIESISLSPDGKGIAFVAPNGSAGTALFTVGLEGGEPKLVLATTDAAQSLSNCGWVSDARLVCQVVGTVKYQDYLLDVSRIVGVDRDGRNQKLLSEKTNETQTRLAVFGGNIVDWLPGETDKLLVGRDFIPEARGNTRLEQKLDGYGVVRLDARTGAVTRSENPKRDAEEYISDGQGRIRIMGLRPAAGASGQMGATINYFYRTKTSDEWRPFGALKTGMTANQEGLNPYAVDSTLDAAYAMRKVGGRLTLVRVALDGTLVETPVFAHPQVDIDGVVTLGRARRVIGVTYVTDRRETVYFDPALKALALSLSKALPGKPLVRFAGASRDEQRLLIWAGSDVDPGRYYVFDRATKNLAEIMLARPELEGRALATQTAITYPAADGTLIPAYLMLPPGSTGKNLPAIVLPHGGPSARDEWGFDWLSQYYAARGYAVLQPQFRGSDGYGDAWFRNQGFRKWAVAIGDVNDAGRWLIKQGIADPAKLGIVGWSYGGYAALQSGVVAPDLFKAVVAIAPVADLALLAEQYRGYTSFALARDFIGVGPHLRDGSPARQAALLKSPVLLFHGDVDSNVKPVQSKVMREALAKAGVKHELITYPGLDHYLDDSVVRADLLRRSDAWLRSAMKLPAD
ncbi:S9 family peptidase [Glacieibacterium frigidum]|uniref:S9 family peptidase n=2 Tax=Glacieibacterium frigidum TaxID=2593303 RepID=A0A552UJC2_9SPHN|nr:S9 family peptidase [Glacieibacterium frigidum]